MPGMNNKVQEVCKGKFREILIAGHFPKVEYHESPHTTTLSDGREITSNITGYNMMEYSEVWTRFAKVVHEKLVQSGYSLGIFETNRKNRNAAFLSAIDRAAQSTTVEEINANLSDRFRGWMD